jgi:hypothetical protein
MDAVQSGELPNVGMANALQQQVSADGGMEMMNNLMSGTALAPGTDTQTNQEAMDYASQQQQPSGPSGFGGPAGTAGVPPV